VIEITLPVSVEIFGFKLLFGIQITFLG
jgi:hypothetical protein